MIPTKMIVAVADNGVFYDRIGDQYLPNLFVNTAEIPENGLDDDGNGFIDDVTGPSTGPAANGYYLLPEEEQWHGTSMARRILDQATYAETFLAGAATFDLSVMPIEYWEDNIILDAVLAGARVISISAFLDHDERNRISDLIKDYDVIVVSADRDNPSSPGPEDVGPNNASYDNFLEVGVISSAIVRGTEFVDLLSEGQTPTTQGESVAVSRAAGIIGTVWAINPELSAAEVVELIGNSTTLNNPIVQQQGLTSEMGGEIDFDAAIELVQATLPGAGTSGDDFIVGTALDDTIYGVAGDDRLKGDLGADTLDGGSGNDIMHGDRSRGDTSQGENDLLLGRAGGDTLKGGPGDDTVDGGEHNDWLSGGVGDDLIIGGDGDDSLRGGDGHDTIDCGDGDDFVRAGQGDDLVYGGAGMDYLSSEAGDDTIYGQDGNDRALGNDGDDLISGGLGNDTLWGQAGDDTLDGGAGSDILQLHAGADTLILDFSTAEAGDTDIVRDLDFGEDLLILRGFGGNPETVVSSAEELYGLGWANLEVYESRDGSRTEFIYDDGTTHYTARLFGVDEPFVDIG